MAAAEKFADLLAAAYFTSAATSLAATTLIAYRIYSVPKQENCSSRRFKQILDIIVQSGVVYSLSLLTMAISTVIVNGNIVGTQSLAFLAYANSLSVFIPVRGPFICNFCGLILCNNNLLREYRQPSWLLVLVFLLQTPPFPRAQSTCPDFNFTRVPPNIQVLWRTGKSLQALVPLTLIEYRLVIGNKVAPKRNIDKDNCKMCFILRILDIMLVLSLILAPFSCRCQQNIVRVATVS
jgi:hypothetical protein